MLLSLLRRPLPVPPIARPCRRARLLPPSRSISTSTPRASSLTPEPPSPEEEAELQNATPPPDSQAALEETSLPDPEVETEYEDHSAEGQQQSMSYRRFLSTIGLQFKHAKPRNWLGGNVVCARGLHSRRTRSESFLQPFPMNPSFRPAPPISDAIRQEMYIQFTADPVENSVRKLSLRYCLGMKRVDAILRLKGMEHSWYKVGPCFAIFALMMSQKKKQLFD